MHRSKEPQEMVLQALTSHSRYCSKILTLTGLTQDGRSASLWVLVAHSSVDLNSKRHCYLQALELDPKSTESWLGLSDLYLSQGLKKEVGPNIISYRIVSYGTFNYCF